MLNFTGNPSSKFQAFLGAVTTTRMPFYLRHDKILVTNSIDAGCLGYLGILTSCSPKKSLFLPNMIGDIPEEHLGQLCDGDIASLESSGKISIYWEISSHQNALFLTEACNCICKMCPQPPQKHDNIHSKNALRVLDLLKGKLVKEICLTGGEPTLDEDSFINIIRRCTIEHPESNISILTNAKKFSEIKFTCGVAKVSTAKITFCVSLHSDIDTVHDDIVGVSGSYNQTQLGIYNLARFGLSVEIRHVISKMNYSRLPEFADHMYRYFPFCCHYAFMALETCGLAEKNFESIYANPSEYIKELRQAILFLKRRDLNPSIYNIPLCLCHQDIHSFTRKSISSWKNGFLHSCVDCSKREDCCGFFTTSTREISNTIMPFIELT